MSRDGSGNYSLPGADFTNGTLADADEVMAKLDDIATALTASIAKDGQTTPTAALPMGGFNHTNVGAATARTHYARSSQVADSSLTYGGVAGGTADALTIAPSPAITAYAIGQRFQFKVGASPNTGAATLNVNSVGAGNITWPNGSALSAADLAANSMVEVVVQATTPVFHLVTAVKRVGTLDITGLTEDTAPDVLADFAAIYDTSGTVNKKALLKRFGRVIPLTSIDLTGASAADLVLDTTNHRGYLFFYDAVVMTSDGANFMARVSTDGGSAYLSTGTYNHARGAADSTPGIAGTGTGGDTAISVATSIDSTASQSLSGIGILIVGGAAAHATKLITLMGYVTSGGVAAAVFGYGSNSTTSQVNAFRHLPSTSTFASGTIHPYAILK